MFEDAFSFLDSFRFKGGGKQHDARPREEARREWNRDDDEEVDDVLNELAEGADVARSSV